MTNTLHPVDQTVLNSIQAIVDYDYQTEAADYERQSPADREGHVFLHLLRVAAWLKDAPTDPMQFVHVVEVFERTDGTYVFFADLDDAKAFEATVNGDRSYRPPRPPLGSACYRTEETVCDRSAALKLIAAECEATSEAESASLESGTPVATCAWKKGEDAPYPDKLEAVEYTCYPTELEGEAGYLPAKIVLWVGLNPDVGTVNVDAGRERLESEGWEVTDWGAA